MKQIITRTESFLHEWNISPQCIDMQAACDAFLEEMERGLTVQGAGSLAMIPTYTPADATIEPLEKVIVLDAGGTNFRTCVVSFDEQLKPTITSFTKRGMPGVHQEVSAKEFFKTLADQVEPLLDASDTIGFCFSYAARITEDHDGIPLMFSKEIKAPEVVGMPVGKSLLEELARRGHDVFQKRIAVVNDTVATLLAGKIASGVTPYDGYIGFILGTGTNTAYVERNDRIEKLEHNTIGNQIINVESGNYDLSLGELDRRFFATTQQPDTYHFEKMISGAYLGAFSHLVIDQAIAERILSEDFAERFYTLHPLDTTRMSHYLEMPHNHTYDLVSCITQEKDATALYMILDAIVARAAKLTAVNLSAAVIKSSCGHNPRYPVCINADGTTFYKTERLASYTQQYLTEFLQRKHHRYTRLVHIDNSPIIGSAVAGLSL
jgi:hexokinase